MLSWLAVSSSLHGNEWSDIHTFKFFVICDLQVHVFVVRWHSKLESELNNIVDFVIISLLKSHCYLHFVVFHVSMLSCGINFVFALYKLYLKALTVFTALLMKITKILLLYNNILKHSWLLVAVQKKIILFNCKATKWTTYVITSYLSVSQCM